VAQGIPSETPVAPLDLDRLAKLNVTGGNIHTIALNAAFASAGDSPELCMPHILKAAKAEFKNSKNQSTPLTSEELNWKEVCDERESAYRQHCAGWD